MTVIRPGAKIGAYLAEQTLTKHIIDASRAGEVVDELLRQWKFELADDIAGTVLEFRLNREVDALCRRLADNPDVPIAAEPSGVRALLAGRVLLFLANSVEEPDAEILASEGPMSDDALHAAVWGLLAKARLPQQVGWEAVRSGVVVSDTTNWHPSGRTKVYDADMNLAGHTRMRSPADTIWFTKPCESGFRVVGSAKRVMFEGNEADRYWIYWMQHGDPADVPDFFSGE